MKDHQPPRRLPARIAIALGYFAGITLIVGWSLPERAATDRRAEPATSQPETEDSGATKESARGMPGRGRTRSKVNCPGCGVVESVRTIEMRDEFSGACGAGESGRFDVGGKVVAAGGRHVESLAETVSATIASDNDMKKVAMTTQHRIVVRFPDGTRLVFDEATPRTLRAGDRIKVIAGALGANG